METFKTSPAETTKSKMNLNLIALIPARYESSRLPGKPLLKICQKSIIQLTYEQTLKSKYLNAQNVFIVTDNDEIYQECQKFNANTISIKEHCANGTSRIAKALNKINHDHVDTVVNVQGDEPFINHAHIDHAIEKHQQHSAKSKDTVCTTIHHLLKSNEDITNPGIGKIVLNSKTNDIIYCSRAVVPHTKSGNPDPEYKYLGHIGLFVFKKWYLDIFEKEDTPAQLTEDIEWLKIIEQSYKIKSFEVDESEIGVNTFEDYQYLKRKYEKNKFWA